MTDSNDNAVRELLLMRVEGLEGRLLALMEGHKLALDLARTGLEKRLDGMSELKEALKDTQNSFVTRKEYDFVMSDIRGLREARAELQGKASQNSVLVSYLLSVAGFVVGLLALFFGRS